MPEIDISKLIDQLVAWSPRLIGALLILIIGFWIVGSIMGLLKKAMKKAKLDESLIPFLASLTNVILKLVVVISAAGIVGIETTSFIAVLGAAGLAIGLALQGSLQNFASGVMVLIFKPYKVGDYVKLQGFEGYVSEIQIFNTIIQSPQNKKVIVPNSAATSGPIENMTSRGYVRADMVFGIAYSADIDKARKVILEVASKHDKILQTPATYVSVLEHAASSVNLAVRPHCHIDDYWGVYFYMHEEIKKAFDREGIEIPYQTVDVNLFNRK